MRRQTHWTMRLSRVLFWAAVLYIIGGLLFECGSKPWRCSSAMAPTQVEAAWQPAGGPR